MLALDVARIEAGLLLIEVDFHSSRKAMIEPQKYSPFELGLARSVDLKKGPFVGRARYLPSTSRRGAPDRRTRSGMDGSRAALRSRRAAANRASPASRVAVPVYKDGRQAGRATSTTWSTTLKKLIALATIDDRTTRSARGSKSR